MAITKTRWQKLLQREMSRKEFFGFMGLTALVVLNVEPLLRFFEKGVLRPVSDGYGSNGYSGLFGDQPPLGGNGKGFDQ